MSLRLDSPGRKSFFLEVNSPVRVGFYTQHLPEEFDLQLKNADGEAFKLGGNFCSEPACEETDTPRIKGAAVPAEAERTWVAQHEHDDEVGSIAIEVDGDCDPNRLNAWLSKLLAGARGGHLPNEGVHQPPG